MPTEELEMKSKAGGEGGSDSAHKEGEASGGALLVTPQSHVDQPWPCCTWTQSQRSDLDLSPCWSLNAAERTGFLMCAVAGVCCAGTGIHLRTAAQQSMPKVCQHCTCIQVADVALVFVKRQALQPHDDA